jgi:hypothetical protein
MASEYEQRREYFENYRKTHKKQASATASAWHAAHREERRAAKLAKRYGISLEQWKELYQRQNGLCALCGKVFSGNDIVVDHCHTTNEIRGLLCHKCNRGLGHFDDNPDRLLKAYHYLVSEAALELLG